MLLTAIALMITAQAQPHTSAPSDQAPVTVTNSTQVPLIGRIGTCQGDGRSYNLRRLMLLENQMIEVDGPRGPLRVSISGEYLLIDTAGPPPRRAVYAANISDAVDPNADLDVELKLGYFEGTLVAFWKETFRHRTYRQGLLRISGETVTPLCEGSGGVTVRD